jgi:hypothetical protein
VFKPGLKAKFIYAWRGTSRLHAWDCPSGTECGAIPSGQLYVRRAQASQFAVRNFREPNWVMLSSVNVLKDYHCQLPARIVIPVDRPRKGLTSLLECIGHNRQGLGRVHALGFK